MLRLFNALLVLTALISALVASGATRNTYWLFLSARKVLFSEMTGASMTCMRRSCWLTLGVTGAWLMRRPLQGYSYN